MTSQANNGILSQTTVYYTTAHLHATHCLLAAEILKVDRHFRKLSEFSVAAVFRSHTLTLS